MNTTFVSCEDALAPIFGVRNFFATVTSVPLLLVPLRALWLAIRCTDRKGGGQLTIWTIMLLGLFLTNLLQHTVGPQMNYLHEVQAAVQNVGHALLLNTIRCRDSMRCLPAIVALALSISAITALLFAATMRPQWIEAACGVTLLVTGPFIVATHGYMSAGDPFAWSLFKRSCAGLVLVNVVVGVERSVCALPLAPYYHALFDHAAIVLLFGSVSRNAVHLVHREPREVLKGE